MGFTTSSEASGFSTEGMGAFSVATICTIPKDAIPYKKITSHPFVKECVAIAVKDEVEEHVPMTYIVLKDEYKNIEKEAEKEIYCMLQKELKEYEIPKYIKIVENLPYTQNGKYDFVSLEKQGNEYVEELRTTDNKQLKFGKKEN